MQLKYIFVPAVWGRLYEVGLRIREAFLYVKEILLQRFYWIFPFSRLTPLPPSSILCPPENRIFVNSLLLLLRRPAKQNVMPDPIRHPGELILDRRS
jgi:hypothetical protein